jgi:hypothetical protein
VDALFVAPGEMQASGYERLFVHAVLGTGPTTILGCAGIDSVAQAAQRIQDATVSTALNVAMITKLADGGSLEDPA